MNIQANPDLEILKKEIRDEIKNRSSEVKELALKIHQNPELGYEEVKAAQWLTSYLNKNSFKIKNGICELPTAFKATYGEGSPTIACLAEYDALPELGHACGHHLIAMCAVAAAVASKSVVDKLGGTVEVIGAPAEELGGRGGKIVLAKEGVFNHLDAVMIAHPCSRNIASVDNRSLLSLKVEFFGQQAHAGARPEAGVNALESMIQSFNGINSLRQRLKNQGSIHGIITDGGKAANIIPAYSAGEFMLRAHEEAELEDLKNLALSCFEGAARAGGTRFSYELQGHMEGMRYNRPLANLFAANMKRLGVDLAFPDQTSPASSDVGNVSRIVPTIQPLIQAVREGTIGHSPEMAEATKTDKAMEKMLNAARAMSMTIADLCSDPELIASLRN